MQRGTEEKTSGLLAEQAEAYLLAPNFQQIVPNIKEMMTV
jgi:hypothetical protein